MPRINIAMERSLRRGVGSYVLDSLLRPRGAVEDIDSVKNTFSSWSNCMAKAYCKSVLLSLSVILYCWLISISGGPSSLPLSSAGS